MRARAGADKRRGTVFEISAGRVDMGADLSWVSQYPGEEEFLFPPLTCLEVVGEPRVDGAVVVFPLRANMNLRGLTLEQLVESRKRLHMSVVKNLREEVDIESVLLLGDFKVSARGPGSCEDSALRSPYVPPCHQGRRLV